MEEANIQDQNQNKNQKMKKIVLLVFIVLVIVGIILFYFLYKKPIKEKQQENIIITNEDRLKILDRLSMSREGDNATQISDEEKLKYINNIPDTSVSVKNKAQRSDEEIDKILNMPN